MPDIIVHNSMGRKVLSSLDKGIQSLIVPDVFFFAVQGPDPFLFYRFFLPSLRNHVHKRSEIMHEIKTGEFLLELAEKSENNGVFSFLSGFLCHYSLDSITHPFIIKMAGDRRYMHTAIEHRLDVIELNRLNKEWDTMEYLFPPFPELQEISTSIKKVYGWDDDFFRVSYSYMKKWYHLVEDRSGLIEKTLRFIKSDKAAIPYSSHICDNYDLSAFDELEEESVVDAVNLITAAYQYKKRQISIEQLQEIIGQRSYNGEVSFDVRDDKQKENRYTTNQ